ncbi:glycoside hydrolase family 3 protein [Moellerella wisconsensis]|uniref:glycoside hydrolase family 3 protein n=1 Tax=Moellerella wisconsensis TaxID=158849 RepID=UPI0030764CC4
MKKTLCALMIFSSLSHADIIPNAQLAHYWQQPESSAKQLVEQMTLEEKLGQILMLDFRYWQAADQPNKTPLTEFNPEIAAIIHQYHLGSVILFRENLINTPQTVKLINAFQQARSNLPLFISTDQEGGYVTRLREGTEMPGNMALGATRSTELAELTGRIHGKELSNLGFNFNFGPVVDVNNNQNNPVIGVRSYSDRPELVQQLANSYIQGIHQYQVMSAVKHFPGHGNVSSDTHFALPTINIDQATWRNIELKPFINTMKATDAIMTAHVVVPALDHQKITSLTGEEIGVPATLSKPILTDILRDELHYDGLIITDAMDMGAISKNFSSHWAIEQAILAGNDIILMPLEISNPQSTAKLDDLYAYLKHQAANNRELNQRINQSAERIVQKKLAYQISAEAKDVQIASHIVASKENKDLENTVSDHAITLIENQHILPYTLAKNNNFVIFSDEQPRNELIKQQLNNIAADHQITINSRDQVVKMMNDDLTGSQIEQAIEGQDFIILVTYNLTEQPNNAQKIIDVANQKAIPLVVISSRNPYDIAYLKNVKANIAIYGITGFDVTNNVRNSLETNINRGLNSLFSTPVSGVINSPRGKLPVDIKTPDNQQILYPFGHGLSY